MKGALIIGVAMGWVVSVQAESSVTALDFVNLFKQGSNAPASAKFAHAKGVCVAGAFTPNSEAFVGSELTSSGPLPVLARFSLGGGNVSPDEREPGVRGIGMQINLPDGQKHHFTGNNFPVFAGNTPDVFFHFLKMASAVRAGEKTQADMAAFAEQNPSIHAHLDWRKQAGAPSSYSSSDYFGVHTFYFQPQQGERIKYRWSLVPGGGAQDLSSAERDSLPPQFLDKRLAEQIKQAPVWFDLVATIGEPADTDTDPSIEWPADRQQQLIGRVTFDTMTGDVCQPVNFDPAVVSAGFAPSPDPVLQMRSVAYAIAQANRLAAQ